jgi:Allene oxide cyclase barrel like domain
MVEKTMKYYVNMEADPEKVPVGWASIYWDNCYNEEDTEQIGTAAGVNQAVYIRESDGHMIQYVTHQWTFPDGAIVAEGPIDRELVKNREWVSIPAKGVSGTYAGLVGLWTWRLYSYTDPLIPGFSNIQLWP